MMFKSTILLVLLCTTLVSALGAGELSTQNDAYLRSAEVHGRAAPSYPDADFDAEGIARGYYALDWSVPLSVRLTRDSLPWTIGGTPISAFGHWASTPEMDIGSPPLNYSISPYDAGSLSAERAAVSWTTVACVDWARDTIAVDEIDAKLTPVSGERATMALRRAWKRARWQLPNLELLTVLAAHWAHETAEGKAMYNYNFGGIKGRAPDGHSCTRRAREGYGSRSRLGLDRFRAYTSIALGADDYLSLLLRRYASALGAAEHGDVDGFVVALRDGGYFTGNALDYARAIARRIPVARSWAISALAGSNAGYAPRVAAPADSVVLTPQFAEALLVPH